EPPRRGVQVREPGRPPDLRLRLVVRSVSRRGVRPRYEHLVFDLDGTLVDSPADLAAAGHYVLRSVGLPERLPPTVYGDVVGGDSLPVRKPDPAGVEYLRARTGTALAHMLLVGDSGVDVRTARAAGIAFCGVRWASRPTRCARQAPSRSSTARPSS